MSLRQDTKPILPATVDLFLFSGQSNMAGRGVTSPQWPQPAPIPIAQAGYEYRAVSAPHCLSPLGEPFGRLENKADGIDDGAMKTGSLVTAFINTYYQCTKTPIVGISASKGGSSILQWQPGSPFLEDAKSRLAEGGAFLKDQGICIRHTYLLWCQGETDGDHGMPPRQYRLSFERMLSELKAAGVETCFLIRIGCYNGKEPISYEDLIREQTVTAQEHPDVVMVSLDFCSMRERGLMKDAFHYYQAAYNEVGIQAGIHAASYVNTGIEPSMFDPYFHSLYLGESGFTKEGVPQVIS